jgi:hypothetical protein
MPTKVASYHSRSQFMVGFDNGLVRVFDMKSYSLVGEIKANEAIAAVSISKTDTLCLAST